LCQGFGAVRLPEVQVGAGHAAQDVRLGDLVVDGAESLERLLVALRRALRTSLDAVEVGQVPEGESRNEQLSQR